MEAKIYKILPHLFLDTDISIWVDGNIFLLIEPGKLAEEFLGEADMAVWKHFNRNCIYEEVPHIIGLGGDRGLYVEEQAAHYRAQGHPANWGLGECNVIIRRHNEKVKRFCNAWWAEICRWSARDQMSFPFVLRNSDIKCNFVPGNPREHKYFKYVPHLS
jgi:hypothetical protein